MQTPIPITVWIYNKTVEDGNNLGQLTDWTKFKPTQTRDNIIPVLRQQAITWTNVVPVVCHPMPSPRHNELKSTKGWVDRQIGSWTKWWMPSIIIPMGHVPMVGGGINCIIPFWWKQGKSEGFGSCDRPCKLKLDSNKFFSPWDLEIWWMTLKNNRAPFLSNIKLCVIFHRHIWIQTWVTVQQQLSGVMTSVTSAFDLWPWPFA